MVIKAAWSMHEFSYPVPFTFADGSVTSLSSFASLVVWCTCPRPLKVRDWTVIHATDMQRMTTMSRPVVVGCIFFCTNREFYVITCLQEKQYMHNFNIPSLGQGSGGGGAGLASRPLAYTFADTAYGLRMRSNSRAPIWWSHCLPATGLIIDYRTTLYISSSIIYGLIISLIKLPTWKILINTWYWYNIIGISLSSYYHKLFNVTSHCDCT